MFSRLFPHPSSGSVNAHRAPGPSTRVALRLATRDDDEAIARLAALYDRPLPSRPLLLAEVDGELHAALTLTGAHELMEPYLPTAALVELLALRAKHLRDQMTPAELAEADAAVRRDPGARRVTHLQRTTAAECCPPASFGSATEAGHIRKAESPLFEGAHSPTLRARRPARSLGGEGICRSLDAPTQGRRFRRRPGVRFR
jgi:hypothetical protein